ncbi:MAG: hypothetical protein ACFE8U_13590 [Candidatus Hermodarchaeota archaeon]
MEWYTLERKFEEIFILRPSRWNLLYGLGLLLITLFGIARFLEAMFQVITGPPISSDQYSLGLMVVLLYVGFFIFLLVASTMLILRTIPNVRITTGSFQYSRGFGLKKFDKTWQELEKIILEAFRARSWRCKLKIILYTDGFTSSVSFLFLDIVEIRDFVEHLKHFTQREAQYKANGRKLKWTILLTDPPILGEK